MMFTPQPTTTNTRRHTAQRGQSIVIALLVLLLLGLAGALFVTVVARNIVNAAHGARVQTADNYARAGLTYADAQLMSSADGADWRPPLQYQLAVPPTEARELARYNAQLQSANNPSGLLPVPATDPDAEYLSAGYARYSTGAGRFLVRVTYDPVNVAQATVPPGKYLKVEAIGREGVIDPNDPTTFGNNRSSDRTQAYQVAYVPIGITDYARFETNPDKRSDIANLGVASQFYAQNTDGGIATPGVSDFTTTNGAPTSPPALQEYPVLTTYGASDAYLQSTGATPTIFPNPSAGNGAAAPTGYKLLPGGGSIHSNMPVRFFGVNLIYLNAGTNSPLFQDTAEIGGDLLLDSYNDANPLYTNSATATAGQQAALILNPANLSALATGVSTASNATTNAYVAPSNSTSAKNGTFDTHGGLIRDGSMQNDSEGLPRSITRLDPPLLDTQDPASQMPRYRAIAMNSAPRPNLMLNGSAYTPPAGINPSAYGYGKAIYVNNPTDVQTDSASIGGGSTLTDEWLHRTTASATAANKGGWNGLFYNPPGVTIVLGQLLTPAASSSSAGTYGIRLTRTAGDSFVGPDGTTPAGPQMDVSYADLGCEATNTNLNAGTSPDNNIVIYAEGNVRVRGIASPDESAPSSQSGTPRKPTTIPRHITIVTNGTAYIEGNLLKGDPDSSISVLAHDYVCVNTTQFLAGTNVEDRTDGLQNPDLPQSGDFLDLDDGHSLLQTFNFGLTGTATPSNYPTKLALYVAAGPASAGSTAADFDILGPTDVSILSQPLPSALQAPPLTQVFTSLTHLTFDLSSPTSTNALLNALSTDLFHLSVSKNPGYVPGSSGVISQNAQDVALERVAVLPMDIRIEAVLYAQTRSFFVIPGEWFNTSADDNLAAYLLSFNNPGGKPSRPNSDDRFPMYGQPIDLKITISGSVSEAHPADIAAQTAWMQKWGWIPQYHGSLVVSSSGGGGSAQTTETAGHTLAGQPAIGLQIVYDPQAGYPYDPMPTSSNNTSPYYLRSDKYGRPLPFTPMLPVSTGLLYSGQSGEAPLLQ